MERTKRMERSTWTRPWTPTWLGGRTAALLTAVLALLPLAAAPAHGWGAIGHRTVGEIAQRHLSPWAAREIAVILAGDSLAEVALWPDDIKSDDVWNHAYTWHFVSVDDDEALATAPRDPRGDVLEALARFEAVLADPTATRLQKAEALRFYVHFVGDIHQPLHVGRRDDRGGNDIDVTLFRRPTNLHAVWDSGLIDSLDLSFTELADFVDQPTPTQIALWQAASYEDWAAESKYLRAAVYDIGDGKLGYEYRYRKLPIIERRLLQAGVRLAGKLDALFAPTEPPEIPRGPAGPASQPMPHVP